MKKIFGRLDGVLGGLLIAASAVGCACAQMHRVEKPETVVRAVGVYEWTGDMAKPTASRLIPVSLYIDGGLQDAGVYLARPIPFALDPGNVYELDQAGIEKGTLDLVFARHLQSVDAKTGDEAYDDGWFGYGAFKVEVAPKPAPPLRRSKHLPVLTSNNPDTAKPQLTNKPSASDTPADPDRPTMKRRDTGDSSASTASTSTTPAASTPATTAPAAAKTDAKTDASDSANDPDRPVMKRRTDDSASASTASTASTPSTASSGNTSSTANTGTTSTGSTPADDPDRPTMKRRNTDDTSSGSTSSGSNSNGSGTSTATTDSSTATTASSGSTPADDPDRPTMKRRDSSTTDTTTTTASTGSVPADDPDRPTLKRRTPDEMKKAKRDAGLSSVSGVGSLNDDPNRPRLHYGKPVGEMTADDLPQLKGMPAVGVHQMVAVSDAKNREPHDFSRPWDDDAERTAVLAKMETMARDQLKTYEAAMKPAAAPAPAPKKTTAAKSSRTKKAAKPAPAAPPEALLDEQLKGYTLSYGGSPVYVFQAQTAGTGAASRYVTVVAQPDGAGELQPALKSVTDAAHLDRTPQLRLVDAVDAQASNRASLLFEMRWQRSRQFALYQVIGARADQIFLTGTTQ